jgi:4-hydroxymandelate oxidase
VELFRSLEAAAQERLPAAVYDYYAGGAGEEQTLAENEAAWRRVWLRPRAMGAPVAPGVPFPVVVAPMGQQGLLHPDGEVAAARAAAACGAGYCLSTRSTFGPEAVGATWFQLYVDDDRAVAEALLRRLRPAGYERVVLTVDLVVPGRRERERRHFGAPRIGGWAVLGWDDLDWVREVSGLPVLVKGVLTAEDAGEAVARGAAGVVVSNHGGRQLDGVVPTAVALREVAAAVAGAVPVVVDGGIRSGADVARALALGGVRRARRAPRRVGPGGGRGGRGPAGPRRPARRPAHDARAARMC